MGLILSSCVSCSVWLINYFLDTFLPPKLINEKFPQISNKACALTYSEESSAEVPRCLQGRHFPTELLFQILDEVDISDDGFLWLNCRPVCHDFKFRVEEIYYRNYIPRLQLATLVYANPITPPTSSSSPSDPTHVSWRHDIPETFYSNESTDPKRIYLDPPTVTSPIPERILTYYTPSRIPHPDPTKVLFELAKPLNPWNSLYINDANIATRNGDGNGETIAASFHHYTRAASSFCGSFADRYVGYYAVRLIKPSNSEEHRRLLEYVQQQRDEKDLVRYHEHHQNGWSSYWAFNQDLRRANTSSSWPLWSDTTENVVRLLPIVRCDFKGSVTDGGFLEIDWRTLVGQCCRVREEHRFVDWGTDLRVVGVGGGGFGNGRTSGIGRIKALRAQHVLWCTYGGLLGNWVS
ncbi:unnamed protein product [Periconia digitata]|uniref:Uncharacterized protein n=1 Tax=Periconia digitata TaxID=1303443 RepID=A0A9W4UIM7_9PLEO|nr:unnamed protein product [Periconia digitata]